MKIETLKTEEPTEDAVVCKIELTYNEVKAIKHALSRTSCKGDELTISMDLEDRLYDVIISVLKEHNHEK